MSSKLLKGIEWLHPYWRQLRDMKPSVEVESMPPANLAFYARVRMDAREALAHARSGDAVAIAAYLGKSDRFDRSTNRLLRTLRGSE